MSFFYSQYYFGFPFIFILSVLYSFLHYHASLWNHFPLTILNVSFHCYLASIVSDNESAINYHVGLMYSQSCFSSAVFKIFFLLALELCLDISFIIVAVSW